MIRLPFISLPGKTQALLAGWQAKVMSVSTYGGRVEAGKRLYKAKRDSKDFGPILEALSEMCSGVRRCCYCEDSAATNVDHIWPQNYYPDRIFSWDNYLYACGRCNQFKADVWDIRSDESKEILSVHKLSLGDQEPPPGDAFMIDPRREDPLQYLRLDLKDTFELKAYQANALERERAEYTVDLLHLNEEDLLPAARRRLTRDISNT